MDQKLAITDEWGVTETLETHEMKPYHEKGVEAMKFGLEGLKGWDNKKEGWKKEAEGKNGEIIYSTQMKVGKVFVAETTYPMSAENFFQEAYFEVEKVPEWNPTIEQYKIVGPIGSQSFITHSKSFDILGGIVKAREFVEASCWRKFDDYLVGASMNIKYPNIPNSKGTVRAENRALYRVSPCGEDKCTVTWLMATDLKGMMLKSLTDRVMHSMMMDYMHYVRIHIIDMNTKSDK